VKRRLVIFVLGSLTMAWPHAAHAQSTTQPAEATATLRIEMVRVKPISQDAPKTRFQLRDGVVDLTKGFSLGGSDGIGATWKMPATTETFDTRYKRW